MWCCTFPGRELVRPDAFGSFNQSGTLDGVPIRLGGKDDVVPVHLDAGARVFVCEASRGLAKQLAGYLFTTELRVRGDGRWHVDETGEWVLEQFTIKDFTPLDNEPLISVVGALRSMPGGDWENSPDLWAELHDVREDASEFAE